MVRDIRTIKSSQAKNPVIDKHWRSNKNHSPNNKWWMNLWLFMITVSFPTKPIESWHIFFVRIQVTIDTSLVWNICRIIIFSIVTKSMGFGSPVSFLPIPKGLCSCQKLHFLFTELLRSISKAAFSCFSSSQTVQGFYRLPHLVPKKGTRVGKIEHSKF